MEDTKDITEGIVEFEKGFSSLDVKDREGQMGLCLTVIATGVMLIALQLAKLNEREEKKANGAKSEKL